MPYVIFKVIGFNVSQDNVKAENFIHFSLSRLEVENIVEHEGEISKSQMISYLEFININIQEVANMMGKELKKVQNDQIYSNQKNLIEGEVKINKNDQEVQILVNKNSYLINVGVFKNIVAFFLSSKQPKQKLLQSKSFKQKQSVEPHLKIQFTFCNSIFLIQSQQPKPVFCVEFGFEFNYDSDLKCNIAEIIKRYEQENLNADIIKIESISLQVSSLSLYSTSLADINSHYSDSQHIKKKMILKPTNLDMVVHKIESVNSTLQEVTLLVQPIGIQISYQGNYIFKRSADYRKHHQVLVENTELQDFVRCGLTGALQEKHLRTT